MDVILRLSIAIGLIKEFGRRIAAITYDKSDRATLFLRQRLSIAVQRGYATCVLGTLSEARVIDENRSTMIE